METTLRPMSLGEILDRTAQLYRTNFLLFAGIAAVNSGILLVLNLGQIGINELLLKLHMNQQLPWVTLIFLAVILPVVFVCAFAAVAANNRAVAWVNLGQPATIVGAYKSILPRLGRYIWLSVIVGFILYAPFVLLFGAYFGFLYGYVKPHKVLAAGGSTDPSGMAVFGLVSLVFILLSMGYMVYAILMGLRYALAVPACVVEDIPARKAIKRSIELSKGSRGRIFMLGLLIVAIQLGLALVTQGVFLVAIFTAAANKLAVPLWIQAAQQIVGFFTNSFIGPMYATGLTLFYYDQRIRKEGFDIEWMMEAAGMTPAPAGELPAIAGAGASIAEPDSVFVTEEVAGASPGGVVDGGESGATDGVDPVATDGTEPPAEGLHG